MRTLIRVAAAVVGLTTVLVPLSPSQAADEGSAVTVKQTAVRQVWTNATGATTTLHTYDISLTVDQTTNLRGRQEVGVQWSGAPATRGIASDVNAAVAAHQEYPFVLLQCRGTKATITPETCWTQGPEDRYQDGGSTFQPWRLDGFAPWSERATTTLSNGKTGALIGAPASIPASCTVQRFSRWVAFRGPKATYAGGPANAGVACAGAAPEAGVLGGGAMPNNTTYGVTDASGHGSAQFDVWTAAENASLGCSDTVACSLVAVPIVGISCDDHGSTTDGHEQFSATQTDLAQQKCDSTDAANAYGVGEPLVEDQTVVNPATTGLLWWSASNWRNRLTVPLHFAPAPETCSVLNPKQPLQVYGSNALTDISSQWAPAFCTNPAYNPFVHVATSDASSRNLLNAGTISAAFSTRGPDAGWSHPTGQAPVALTGFAIAFDIDGADGQPVTTLRLDARLLAKLLTQSYPAEKWIRSHHPGLANNPLNITLDPEFQALNPGNRATENDETRSTILALSSQTDLTWALTSYINADPTARAWLDGTPDPWGMVVNPAYKRIALPSDSWSLLDDWTPPVSQPELSLDACYPLSPVPYLNLIANPTSSLATVIQSMQFAISNVADNCPPNSVQPRYVTNGRQTTGNRFILGVVPLSAVGRYSLSAAQLQSSGTAYVAPDAAGLKAAATLLKPSSTRWDFDYAGLSRVPTAYPGAMPVYADVPTKGLDAQTASSAAEFLRFAVTTGQVPGSGNGQLAAGALPLTAANGLGALKDYTLCIAKAVAAQNGFVPTVGGACEPKGPVAGPTKKPTVVVTSAGGALPGAVVGSDPVAATAPGTTRPGQQAITLARYSTAGGWFGLGAWGLPLAVLAAFALAAAAAISRWGAEIAPYVRGVWVLARARGWRR